MRSGQSGAGCHPTALAVQAIACLASDSHERLGGGWFEITLAASRHNQPRQPRQSHQNVRRPHGVRIAACRRATRGRRANPPDPPIRDPQRHNETTSPDSSIDSCVKLYLLIVHGLIRHAALPGQANLRRSGGVDLGSDNRLDLLEIYLSSALARASWIPRLVMHGIVLSAAGSHPSAAHIQVAEWV